MDELCHVDITGCYSAMKINEPKLNWKHRAQKNNTVRGTITLKQVHTIECHFNDLEKQAISDNIVFRDVNICGWDINICGWDVCQTKGTKIPNSDKSAAFGSKGNQKQLHCKK